MDSTLDDIQAALDSLPVHSLMVIAGELQRHKADCDRETYYQLDSLEVDILNIAGQKLQNDDGLKVYNDWLSSICYAEIPAKFQRSLTQIGL